MSLINFKNENNYYIESKNIKVFPCAYRNTKDDEAIFNIESRLNTEYNQIYSGSLNTRQKSFIIEILDYQAKHFWDEDFEADSIKTLKFVIQGYLFEVTFEANHYLTVDELNNKYLYISLLAENLESPNTDDLAKTTTILSSFIDEVDGENLDYSIPETTTYIFTGLLITEAPPTDIIKKNTSKQIYYIQFFKNGEYLYQNELPNIASDTTKNSIKLSGILTNSAKTYLKNKVSFGNNTITEISKTGKITINNDTDINDTTGASIKTLGGVNIAKGLSVAGKKITIDGDTGDFSATSNTSNFSIDGTVSVNNSTNDAFYVAGRSKLGKTTPVEITSTGKVTVNNTTSGSDGHAVEVEGDAVFNKNLKTKTLTITENAALLSTAPGTEATGIVRKGDIDDSSTGYTKISVNDARGSSSTSINAFTFNSGTGISTKTDSQQDAWLFKDRNKPDPSSDEPSSANTCDFIPSTTSMQNIGSSDNIINNIYSNYLFTTKIADLQENPSCYWNIWGTGNDVGNFKTTGNITCDKSFECDGIITSTTTTKEVLIKDGYNLTSNNIDATSLKITGLIQAYRYNSGNVKNQAAITLDKPGTHAIGIGPDGTDNRIKFGPVASISDTTWKTIEEFNDNEFYFQGKITTTNEVQAPSFYATSDKRLKENITEYTPKKSILDLPIYKYNFINNDKIQIGCLAQDLQEICPEIVTEKEDGYLSIQESKIVYLLLDEVKKLKKEIQEMKK